MGLRRRRSALSRKRVRPVSAGRSESAGFSYRSNRSDQEANLGRNQRESAGTDSGPSKDMGRFLLQRFGLVVLLIALVFSVSNALTLSSDARVVMLKDDRSSPFLHSDETYQEAASDLLADSVWNRSKLTVNTGDVRDGLLSRFPELADVSVALPLLGNRPTLYVQTSQEALILATDNGSFVIDTTGRALLNADNIPSGKRHGLPKVTDKSGLRVSLNEQALSSADVGFIRTVNAQLAARRVGISSMDLPAGKSELDVHIAGKPYYVKFNLENGTARQQAGTFLATKKYLERRNITPAQYIDVRVDGRAYYR